MRKTRKLEAGYIMSEIVMPERMKQRRAKLLNATYEYFLTLLEMDRNEAASRFPLDEKLMWVLFGYATYVVRISMCRMERRYCVIRHIADVRPVISGRHPRCQSN